MFNPAGLGSVATSAKHKQDLKAFQATPVEAKEYTIQWPGSPVDGLTATLHSSIHGECIVILANGRSLSVPPSSLVAAPSKRTQDVIERTMRGEPEKKKAEKKEDKKDDEKDEKKSEKKSEEKEEPKKSEKKEEKNNEKSEPEKTKKVVPSDKPDARGGAVKEEDLTKRALEHSKVGKEKPPVLRYLTKKGPDSVNVEDARSHAPEAKADLKKLVTIAEAMVVNFTAVKEQAEAMVQKAKGDSSEALADVYEKMEKTGQVVVRIAERLVAIDEKRTVASTNIPQSGALRMKIDAEQALLESLKEQFSAQKKVVDLILKEAERTHGATYNIEPGIAIWPAHLQASVSVAAGFMDLVKSFTGWVESLFSTAEAAEAGLDDIEAELESGNTQESAVEAAKKGDQYAEVVKLLKSRYGLEPNDWGGEDEIRSRMDGMSAVEYVDMMAEKWDLQTTDEASGGYGNPRGSKVKASAFDTFQASLKARTGLKASEAGIKDEATFKARVAPMGVNAWVSGFIKKHGLNDLAPRFKADYDTATMEYKHDRGTEQGGPPTSVDLGTKPKMPKQTDRSGPYGRNSALPGIKILLGNYDGSTTSIVEMTTYNPTHDSFVDFESGNSNAIDVQHIVNNIVSPYFEPKGHGVWMTDSSPFEGSDSDNEGWAELERDIMSALKDAGHRVESEGAGSFDLIYVDMPDSFTVNGGKRNRLAPRAMGKKNPTDPMAKHPSWAKYGAKFPWQKILSADEINMVPEIKAIPGYDANQGAWFPQESREGLINWVTAHPEFDLVTQLDEGDDVYGLAVVNRDWYKLGLRDNAARTKWFGAA